MFRRKKKKELSEADRRKAEKTLNTIKKVGALYAIHLREKAHQEFLKEEAEMAGEEYVDLTSLNTHDRIIIAERMIRDSRRSLRKGEKKDLLDRVIDVRQHEADRRYEKSMRNIHIDIDDMFDFIVLFVGLGLLLILRFLN